MSKTKQSCEKYLSTSQLDELVKLTSEFYKLRNSAYEKFGIDLLDSGDSLSSANLYSIVKQYDHSFLPNFHRNGVDGKSSVGGVEIKNTRVDSEFTKKGKLKKNPHNATWTLHAISDYSDRYIFVARSKITLEPVRIYDISDSIAVAKVVEHLENQRQIWLAKSSGDIKKMKNDRIGISEKFIKELGNFEVKHIDSCQVFIK